MAESPTRRTITRSISNPKSSKIIRFKRPANMVDVNMGITDRNRAPKRKSNASNVLWVNANHPDEFKDPKVLKGTRRHVMINYLETQDKKVNGKTQSVDDESENCRNHSKRRKLKREDDSCTEHKRPSVSLDCDTTAEFSATITAPEDGMKTTFSDGVSKIEQVLPIDYTKALLPPSWNLTPDMSSIVSGTLDPLVRPSSSFEYRNTSVYDVPDIIVNPGSTINPFETLPAFQEVNTVKLKHDCSQYFSSHQLVTSWLPTLLKARHAFLSTICISAAHDDIMRRSQLAEEDRTPFALTERFQVNAQVVHMINDALKDPQTQVADTTIVAVLQILSSEIMGCNDYIMAIHQKGLHDMVTQRGGLSNLGVDGHLASILAINMYMISVLRETIPHREYEKWASQRASKPSDDAGKVPESPVYCRLGGFRATKTSLAPADPTNDLLETLRLLTNSFSRATDQALLPPVNPINDLPWNQTPIGRIDFLYNKIIAYLPSNIHPYFQAYPTANSHIYEALRLVSLIYAQALYASTPFSAAAQTLNRTLSLRTPIHVLIHRHISLTDLSSCWGDLAGVLFFATLVASASANPRITTLVYSSSRSSSQPQISNQWNVPTTQEDSELSRKWLAAVTVRCSIVLGFEHGRVVLETLRRLVGIEQAIANAWVEQRRLKRKREEGDEVRGKIIADDTCYYDGEEDGVTVPGTGVSLGGNDWSRGKGKSKMYGPEEAGFLLRRRNFMDFAEEFRRGMD